MWKYEDIWKKEHLEDCLKLFYASNQVHQESNKFMEI